MTPPKKTPTASVMTEEELSIAIIQAALFLGWKCHHDRRSDLARQQGTPGFPDLVLIRGGRIWMLELKSDSGHLTRDQLAWQLEMPVNSYAFTYRVVYPGDLDSVLEELVRG